MIEVRMASPTAAGESELVGEITELVNTVYAAAEAGLWVPGTTRTRPQVMADLIAAGEIAVARADGHLVGAVRVHRLATGIGEFGMLVAAPDQRGQGVGRELVSFAESRHRAQGVATMQLELLVPRLWSHPSKEFLKVWYSRIGYRAIRSRQIEESHPDLAPHLATPCDVLVYQKSLTG